MAYQLEFERLFSYDVGQPGITLQASLKIKEQSLDVGRFGWLDRVVLGLVDYEGKFYLSRYDR